MSVGFLGALLVKISFFAGLAASVLYYLQHDKPARNLVGIARSSYYGAVLTLLGAGATLLTLILNHRFEFTYIWSYSSTDLSLPLLISTFYAGQEGSFTLWAIFTALIGLFLLSYSARRDNEPEVMSVYSLILSFLLLMLVVKNPFKYIWDSFPADLLRTGPVPPGVPNSVILDEAKGLWATFPVEGRGLNPLLQNYWMVIHPQVLFTGFSAMAVPYASAVAALLKRDYSSWVKIATPWLVFGAMLLGTGIILGGYWAYETLGWGGFWAWDPVENSSLVPWLLCVAAIHTMLIQRKSGTFVRTNFLLSILSFMAVLYSTFLTRSGVLGETSVHSFVEAGDLVYWLLLGGIGFFACLGGGLLLFRRKDITVAKAQPAIISREFALFLGAFALAFVAFFVTIGTSSPIISAIIKGKASAVEMDYYIRTNLPLGIAIAFLSGLGQLLWWKSSRSAPVLKSLLVPAVLAAVTTGVVLILGSEEILILLFTFFSAFSLFANAKVGYAIYRGNPKFIGGSLAHIGIAVLFLGFVTSERYDRQKTVSLEMGKPVEALGYTLKYTGAHPIEGGKWAFNVEIQTPGAMHVAAPTMYYSEFTKGIMRHPDVLNMINQDFYVAPLSHEDPTEKQTTSLELHQGSPLEHDGMTLTYTDFTFTDEAREAMLQGGPFEMRVQLLIGETGSRARTRVALRMVNGATGGVEFPTERLVLAGGKELELQLQKIAPPEGPSAASKVSVAISRPLPPGAAKAQTLVVEASIKPMINLVWAGTVTLIIGFVLTIMRRVSEARTQTHEGDEEHGEES